MERQLRQPPPNSLSLRTTTESAGRDSCFLAKEQSLAHRLARPLAAEPDDAQERWSDGSFLTTAAVPGGRLDRRLTAPLDDTRSSLGRGLARPPSRMEASVW